MSAATGYEGKFDFPRRTDAPERTYMLASLPRSGSTWFSHLLWATGNLGAPLEYLNFEPAGPYFFARSAAVQQQLWQSVLQRRTSPNGVFGAKCFAGQLETLQQENPELLAAVMATLVTRAGIPRIIYFRRRDQVAHAISYARASLSGVWRKEQEADRAEVDYSEIAIERSLAMIEAEDAAWQQMFSELRLDPLTLWYEDALDDPEEGVRQVAAYVGVTIDPAAKVSVPSIEKQSAGDAVAWAARYAGAEKNN